VVNIRTKYLKTCIGDWRKMSMCIEYIYEEDAMYIIIVNVSSSSSLIFTRNPVIHLLKVPVNICGNFLSKGKASILYSQSLKKR
jgi:hypothetical protein